jgi:hypothetical protein
VVGFGLSTQFALHRAERPLVCADEHVLAATYRSRFFLRVAVSHAAALVGFVGAIMVGAVWAYLLGLLIAALGLSRAAPSRRNIAHDEEQLQVAGCGLSLLSALQRSGPVG